MLVIGAGRIGTALGAASPAIALIDRERGWEKLDDVPGRPIVVAVRNDALDDVVARVPSARHPDLVFIQNGMLRPWLASRGLEDCTRGLLFFAVAKRGDSPIPGAASPFMGPHSQNVAQTLGSLGLPARGVSPTSFAEIELEKLIWNCAFGLLCEAQSADVGVVATQHRDRLTALVAELNAVGQAGLGADLELEPLVERLCDYSLSIASYRGAVKEWKWRNGWFVETARQQNIETPVHAALLAQTGHPR